MNNLRELTEYEKLPEVIQFLYTEEEYLWLPETQKKTIIRDETEPECE